MPEGHLKKQKSWLRKARQRELITDDQMTEYTEPINQIGPKLNALINSFGKSKSSEMPNA